MPWTVFFWGGGDAHMFVTLKLFKLFTLKLSKLMKI